VTMNLCSSDATGTISISFLLKNCRSGAGIGSIIDDVSPKIHSTKTPKHQKSKVHTVTPTAGRVLWPSVATNKLTERRLVSKTESLLRVDTAFVHYILQSHRKQQEK
jgi:hypothetical protein